MKKAIIFILIITALLISYLLYKNKNGFDKNVIINKIKNKNGKINNFVYINVWNSKCKPCLEEMLILDSIAKIYNTKIDFVFMTDDCDEKAAQILQKKRINIKNSLLFNNEEETINYLCAQKHVSKSYPLHFIITDKFEIIHFHSGAIMGDIFDPVLMTELNRIVNSD